jgi:hypothetical protein
MVDMRFFLLQELDKAVAARILRLRRQAEAALLNRAREDGELTSCHTAPTSCNVSTPLEPHSSSEINPADRSLTVSTSPADPHTDATCDAAGPHASRDHPEPRSSPGSLATTTGVSWTAPDPEVTLACHTSVFASLTDLVSSWTSKGVARCFNTAATQ